MYAYFQAEKMKSRHTMSGRLIIIMPLLSVALAAILTGRFFAIDVYNWWYFLMLPGMLFLICGAAGARDKKMQNRAILVLPVDIKQVWDAKVMTCVSFLCKSMAVLFAAGTLAEFILKQVLNVRFEITLSFIQEIGACIILIITFLWLIPFGLLLEQLLGMFPMLLIGMGIHTVLSVTLSLKPYFMVFPAAIPARLMITVLKVLPNGLPARAGEMTFSPELISTTTVIAGTAVSVIWFVVFWLLTRNWYERQMVK